MHSQYLLSYIESRFLFITGKSGASTLGMKFSIFNFQFSKTRGFTLIELLVVMSIVVIVGGLIVSILFITFRGSNKAETMSIVKQNGTFALSQMVKQIRYARSLDMPSSCVPTANAPTLTVTSLADGEQTTFSCPSSQNTPITSNSAALVDSNAVSVTYCSFTCTQNNISEPPRVTIQFTLSSVNTSGLVEAKSSIPFQTSVIMRNASQ
jgi:prepilin-type N-terminal cleavage/methylation domain-containing protein